jgi:radical SAM protein with 4Fe4S-binding SPASM domain
MKKEIKPKYIKRSGRNDPETLLEKALFKKYGDRFSEYRENYKKTMNNPSSGYSYLPDYPISVLLEFSNRCNLECIMCYSPHREGDKTQVGEECLDKLFAEFEENNLPAVMFGAGDEPFLYKKIFHAFEKSVDAGIMDVFVFTNGALLDEKKSKLLMKSGVTRVFVSIDAATEEAYDLVRVEKHGKKSSQGNRLEKLDKNIIDLVELRSEMKSLLPIIRVSFAVQEENIKDVAPFKDKWEGTVDYIEFQSCSDCAGVSDTARLTENERWKRNDKDDTFKCTAPWNTVTVWANGDISPCCTFYGKNLPIGNIKDVSVKQAWNSDKMNELRSQFRDGEVNVVCQTCLKSRRDDLFSTL